MEAVDSSSRCFPQLPVSFSLYTCNLNTVGGNLWSTRGWFCWKRSSSTHSLSIVAGILSIEPENRIRYSCRAASDTPPVSICFLSLCLSVRAALVKDWLKPIRSPLTPGALYVISSRGQLRPDLPVRLPQPVESGHRINWKPWKLTLKMTFILAELGPDCSIEKQ